MNCSATEREILLAEAGDLTSRRQQRLETHLAACPRCRAYREAVRRIEAAGRDALPEAVPSATALAAIRAAAEERQRSDRVLVFRQPAARALAYAAALLLILGGWWLGPRDNRVSRIENVSTIVAMVAEEYPDGSGVEHERSEAERLRSLAADLLDIQGFAVDDLSAAEDFTLPEEPDPTASQPHSTREPGARRRV